MTRRRRRARQLDDLARKGRYPSGPLVPAVSRAFAAFEQRDFSAASDALEPIAGGGPPGDCRVCRFGQPDGPVRDEVAMSA
jgi:hypothetical protein